MDGSCLRPVLTNPVPTDGGATAAYTQLPTLDVLVQPQQGGPAQGAIVQVYFNGMVTSMAYLSPTPDVVLAVEAGEALVSLTAWRMAMNT